MPTAAVPGAAEREPSVNTYLTFKVTMEPVYSINLAWCIICFRFLSLPGERLHFFLNLCSLMCQSQFWDGCQTFSIKWKRLINHQANFNINTAYNVGWPHRLHSWCWSTDRMCCHSGQLSKINKPTGWYLLGLFMTHLPFVIGADLTDSDAWGLRSLLMGPFMMISATFIGFVCWGLCWWSCLWSTEQHS